MRWIVFAGLLSWSYDDLKQAKNKAREYSEGRIFECFNDLKFLRYYMRNGRLVQICAA